VLGVAVIAVGAFVLARALGLSGSWLSCKCCKRWPMVIRGLIA